MFPDSFLIRLALSKAMILFEELNFETVLTPKYLRLFWFESQ